MLHIFRFKVHKDNCKLSLNEVDTAIFNYWRPILNSQCARYDITNKENIENSYKSCSVKLKLVLDIIMSDIGTFWAFDKYVITSSKKPMYKTFHDEF